MTDTERKAQEGKCWLFHKWGRWGNPYTPEGFYKSFAIQRRTCERCNMTQQRMV